MARLVATPGESLGGDQVLWKLSGVKVWVAGFFTTPEGSKSRDQVLWKLSGVQLRWQDLLQHLEEVGRRQGLVEAFRGQSLGEKVVIPKT